MKSTPLIINWHDQNAPIYSAHFEPSGKGRLATAGGDSNVRVRRPLRKHPLSSTITENSSTTKSYFQTPADLI